MKDVYKRFKKLTGFSYTDIANKLGVSRQAVDQMFSKRSVTHVNANKWILTKMIDEAIEEQQYKIEELRKLRSEIGEYQTK